jgi:hypothetical protein
MADEVVVPQVPQTEDGKIDFAKWEKDRPQREAERASKAAEEKKGTATEVPKADDKTKEGETPRLPRSTVRELNKLRTEAAEERGRRLALEEMHKGTPAAAKPEVSEDPEPQRKDFADDATFNRAAGRWDARQEAKKVVSAKEAETSTQAALREELKAADEKFQKDREAIGPEWDEALEALKAMEADEEAPTFVMEEHPIVFGGLAASDVRAHVLVYLARHPKELQRLLDMTATKDMTKDQKAAADRAQARAFNRLEGTAETWYSANKSKAEPKKEAAKSETAAERDAKLPKPSEAVAPRGGVPTDGKVSMFLADGVTVNPSYLADFQARRSKR